MVRVFHNRLSMYFAVTFSRRAKIGLFLMPEQTDTTARYNAEVKAFLPRNYAAHAVEGGLYMAGIEFASRDTILPPLIEELGGPTWLVAISPVLMSLGVSLPSIFLVHKLEALYWKKPLLLLTGVVQRLPFLFAGLALIFLAGNFPLITLIFVALAQFGSGFVTGVTFPAWLELVAKTIPAHRRASVFAIRMVIAAIGGMCASLFVKVVLAEYGGPVGFGILHLACFAFVVLSYIVFATIKETNLPPDNPGRHQTFLDSLREVPDLLGKDSNLLKFVASRFLVCGKFIAIPFLAIHLLENLGKKPDFLGVLLAFLVGGKIIGNVVMGYIGDRLGAKIGLVSSVLILALVFPAAISLQSVWLAGTLYALYGFGFSGWKISDTTFRLDLAPENRRTKYQSIMNLSAFPGMLAAFAVGWAARGLFAYSVVAWIASATLLMSALIIAMIPEPRKRCAAA